jgi:hypothetical protein
MQNINMLIGFKVNSRSILKGEGNFERTPYKKTSLRGISRSVITDF